MQYFSKYPFIEQDKNAKSLSFFCKKDIVALNRDAIEELKRAASSGGADVRISMHPSPESDLHNMIILQHKETYVRPHKHLTKTETYQLIEGEHLVVVFDEQGIVIDSCNMSLEDNFLYRFEKNQFHMSIPISDFVIFHESKIGPFIREGDSVFADWAPITEDVEEVRKFTSKLIESESTL
jgi:cupin fold WbuC family metalloprotein